MLEPSLYSRMHSTSRDVELDFLVLFLRYLSIGVYLNITQITEIAGPHAWNTLPDFVTDCSSSRTFKQYLKTYLFSLSF